MLRLLALRPLFAVKQILSQGIIQRDNIKYCKKSLDKKSPEKKEYKKKRLEEGKNKEAHGDTLVFCVDNGQNNEACTAVQTQSYR